MDILPPSLNELIGTARRHPHASAQLKRKWHKRIEPEAAKLQPMVGKVWIECVWILKDRRKDIDNVCAGTKIIFDSLVNVGIIEDDGQRIVQSPIIHHAIISKEKKNAFIIYIRDAEAFQKRLTENLSLPPGTILPNFVKPKLSKVTSCNKITVKNLPA
jgi:Holliday junction resolvase RusA-like endonuclease